MGASQFRKQAQQMSCDADDEQNIYPTRPPSSARRYRPGVQHDTIEDPALQGSMGVQRRRASLNPNATTGGGTKAAVPPLKQEWQKPKKFPVVAILLGMVVMALLVFALSAFGSWWRIHQDDVTYGRPRTFQCDAAVGHGTDSNPNSHFIAVNLNRHIEIIEIPGGDPSKSKIYVGSTLMGDNAELLPVTLSFRSVSGGGKPDMIISVRGNTTVMINTGDGFRPVQPDDHINI